MNGKKKILGYCATSIILIVLVLAIVQLLGVILWERNFAVEIFAREGLPAEAVDNPPAIEPAYPIESDYGYLQLNTQERKLYRTLENGVAKIQEEQQEDGTYPIERMIIEECALDEQTLKKVISVFINENPECFWLVNTFHYSILNNSTNLYVSSYVSDSEREKMAEQLRQAREAMTSAARVIGKKLDRELYLFESLTTSCTYEKEDWKSYTAYGALVEGKAVCEGYSRAFRLLCEQSGIPCYIILGQHEGGDHMWNIVEIDDRYYHIDVTGCDNSELVNYVYVNLSDKVIGESHKIYPAYSELDGENQMGGNLVYPTCDSMDANYYKARAFQITSVQKNNNDKMQIYLEEALNSGKSSVSFYIADSLPFEDSINKLFSEKPHMYVRTLERAAKSAGQKVNMGNVQFVADESVRGLTIKLTGYKK